jgi:chromosome partitioning protein
MIAANKISVMEGNLSDFHLVEILQVLSVSRQYTRIALFSSDRTPAGSLFIKSGKVVHASAGSLRGRDAFVALVRKPPSFFNVFRIQMPALIPEPIGTLTGLLFLALEEQKEVVPPASRPASRDASRLAFPAARSPHPSGVMPAVGAAGGPCVIAVASPKGGAGKTTVALNLALSLARRGHSVILVDGDVNGDVLSCVDERSSARVGVFDVLAGQAEPVDALRKTVVPNLQIVPATGLSLPNPEFLLTDCRDRWHGLVEDLSRRAEIVLVDTPAGMFGVTHQILSSCTHVLGVLQAEVIAERSFTMFTESLETLPDDRRPRVLGVFLNMLQLGHIASIGVLEKACEKLPRGWLFETSIPRNPAFLDATLAGVPLHLYDPEHPPSVSWLFDTLATEITDRLDLVLRETKTREYRFLA